MCALRFFPWIPRRPRGLCAGNTQGVGMTVQPQQGFFRPAGCDAPRAGSLVCAQVACHGLAGVRIDRRACQVAYVKAGPTADALLVVCYHRLVGLPEAGIHRAHFDAGRIITSLADNGQVLGWIGEGVDLYARAMGAQNAVVGHGAGQFTKTAAVATGRINENVPAFRPQCPSCGYQLFNIMNILN